MQTLLIEVKNDNAFEALHVLENQNFIRIVSNNDISDSNVLSGNPMSVSNFINWINNAENSPTISLSDANKQWNQKKQRLEKNIL